jgi:hypothetical protein
MTAIQAVVVGRSAAEWMSIQTLKTALILTLLRHHQKHSLANGPSASGYDPRQPELGHFLAK